MEHHMAWYPLKIQNTLHEHDISIDKYEYFDGQLSEFISLQF